MRLRTTRRLLTATGRYASSVGLACLLGASVAQADPPVDPLSLEAAVDYALAHQPALDASRARERIAVGQVEQARADELPVLGVSAQFSRATGNVVPGSFYGTVGAPWVPAVAGPLTGRSMTSGRWGSEVGLYAGYDVGDLPRRMRLVDAALAERRQAEAGTAARSLEVAYSAADAFLAVLATVQVVRATEAAVQRADAFARVVHTLVDQQLRPGADAARADADLAVARTLLARAEQAEGTARAHLATVLGDPGARFDLDGDSLIAPPPPVPAGPPVQHPALVEAEAAVDAARLRVRATHLEYVPRIDLIAAVFVRGSGYFPSASDRGSTQGILPNTPNWGAAIYVTWPILELFAVRAREHTARADRELADARVREIGQAIAGQLDEAGAVLEGTQRVARNAIVAVVAARAEEQQALARYQAGLATVLEVAEAQRLLTQTEVDEATAWIDVRRAQLLAARALGDLTPFLVEVRRASVGGP